MLNRNFLKQFTKFFLILYIAFSSGIVLFSYECRCGNHFHSHLGIMKEVNCNNHCDCEHNINHNHSHHKHHHNEYEEHSSTLYCSSNPMNDSLVIRIHHPVVKSLCGITTIKVLKTELPSRIKTSDKIMPNIVNSIHSIIKAVCSSTELVAVTNKIKQFVNYIPPDLSFLDKIIQYIHNHTLIPSLSIF